MNYLVDGFLDKWKHVLKGNSFIKADGGIYVGVGETGMLKIERSKTNLEVIDIEIDYVGNMNILKDFIKLYENLNG